jgi:G3E family GTPase
VNERTPVTVVTGFLGSGKTTLINGLLRHPDMAETAVLVNEFGEIGLDHLLVEHIDETTVLIGSGCLCCAVREDLVAALCQLLKRRDSGELPHFRRILIETTGLADPAPILHTLLADQRVSACCRIEDIVTTIDAVHGSGQLSEEGECLRQAAVADRLVLTKADLAQDKPKDDLIRRLRTLNEDAELLTVPVVPGDLFDRSRNEDDARTRRWLDADNHAHHDDTITSFALTAQQPLRIDRVVGWVDAVIASHGDRLLRLKGILDLEGSEVPVAVHGVQHVFHPLQRLAAWPEGLRHSRLVLIGRDLPIAAMTKEFYAVCQPDRR